MARSSPESKKEKPPEDSKKSVILSKARSALKEIHTSTEYMKQFEGWEIRLLKENDVDFTNPKEVKKIAEYKPRFDVEDILPLLENKISAKKAKRYPKRFDGWSITGLVQANIDETKAASYPDRFDSTEITTLVQNDINADLAKSYPERFNGWEIAELHLAGIKPEQAALCPKKTKTWEFIKLAQSIQQKQLEDQQPSLPKGSIPE